MDKRMEGIPVPKVKSRVEQSQNRYLGGAERQSYMPAVELHAAFGPGDAALGEALEAPHCELRLAVGFMNFLDLTSLRICYVRI